MIALSPGPLSSPPIPANTLLPRQSSSYPYVSPFLPHVLPPPSSPPLSFRPHIGSHNWRVFRIAKLCHVEKTASSPMPSHSSVLPALPLPLPQCLLASEGVTKISSVEPGSQRSIILNALTSYVFTFGLSPTRKGLL